MIPKLATSGMLVAGDAASLCLAAGIWLEGVNFAIASGMYAGEAADEALRGGDVSAAGLAGYERRLASTFVLRDHRKLRGVPVARAVRPGAARLSAVRRQRRRADVPRRQPGTQARVAAHRQGGTAAGRNAAPRSRTRRLGRNAGVRMTGHSEWSEISFEDRMATTRFDVHERPHIVVDGAVCTDCSTRDCIVACPADLFVPTADGGILFNYEQCFECGTCYLVCNREGAISWSYPEGGYGVVFRRT